MRITLKNFRCYIDQTFEFGKGGIVLLSGPSGQGKSSILFGIYFALYGSGSKVTSFGKTSCSVELEFDGMKIIRSKRPNRVVVDSVYEDDVAQELINKKFGDAFDVTGYVAQNAINSFILMSPIDKLSFLEKFAFKDVDVVNIKSRCKSHINKCHDELLSVVSQLDMANNFLSEMTKPNEVKFPLKCKDNVETREKAEKNEQIKMNNGYKKLIDNYKEDLRLCEDKNKKNVTLLMTIENEKNQLESKFILINQQINLLNEENHKLKKDIDMLKNQKNITLESIIKKLEREIEQKNNEIEILKIKTSDTNIITKLNEVIENQNNELKSLDDKYKNVCEDNDRLKLENIELQVEINHLIKSDDDIEYTSNYDTEYESDEESDEETELKKNTRKLFGLTHRKLRQPTQDFFDNLLIEQQNEKCKEVVIKEPINYSFSTDYHVEMLQNSNKLVPKEERKYYNDKLIENNNSQKDIFIKSHPVIEPLNNINNSLEIIINDKENSKIIIDDDKKVINEHKIQNINHIVGGGKNKDRFTIHDIEGTLKMYINNDFSTITDQNIDKNDIDLGRKIYNRKNVRRCRNKNN